MCFPNNLAVTVWFSKAVILCHTRIHRTKGNVAASLTALETVVI